VETPQRGQPGPRGAWHSTQKEFRQWGVQSVRWLCELLNLSGLIVAIVATLHDRSDLAIAGVMLAVPGALIALLERTQGMLCSTRRLVSRTVPATSPSRARSAILADVHLYQGTSEQFIGDATQARLANLLADRFFEEFRYRPGPSEVTSWRNSLLAMASVLQVADLTDQGILVELKLPLSSKRLDVLLTGSNPNTRRDSAVIVELKQWTEVGRSNITDCVTVDFGGRLRAHLHPSRQVAQYQRYLLDTHPAFADDRAIALDACAYLHYAQHDPKSPLYHADFAELLATNPAFAGNELDAFASFLDQRVAGPDAGGAFYASVVRFEGQGASRHAVFGQFPSRDAAVLCSEKGAKLTSQD